MVKKVEGFKDHMGRVGSLLSRYFPSNPQSVQPAFHTGKTAFNEASGQLTFSDYVNPGDKVTLAFDPADRTLPGFHVATHLDGTEDMVTLPARFSSNPDGTDSLEQSVLDGEAQRFQNKTSNFGHQKASQ